MLKYRAQLAELLQKDEEDTAAVDARIEKQAEEQRQREDAMREAEDAARICLADEVHRVLERQIQEKEELRLQAAEAIQQERMKFEDETAQLTRIEESAKAEAVRKALEQRLELESQITLKAQLKAAEEHDRLMELQVGGGQEYEASCLKCPQCKMNVLTSFLRKFGTNQRFSAH